MEQDTAKADWSMLLAGLGRRFGIASLTSDATGACTLRFSRRLDVCLAPADDGRELGLFAVLGTLPPAHAASLALRMLKANFLGRATQGATLALAPQGCVVLSRRLGLHGMDAAALEEALQAFAEVALQWVSWLEAPPLS